MTIKLTLRETLRCIRVFSTLACMLMASSVHAQALRLPGQFDVGASGAATYTIPIAVPPGTGGVEPALTLNYSSQGGNGLLGLGWSVGGLPEIQRCPRTVAQDGVKGSVNHTSDDRFCLNGDRLVAISGAYGANNTEYRTELESFAKVVSYGTAGTGPQWFKVWTKTGQVIEFGNNANSRVLAGTTVRRWHANQITDTTGNYLTISYTNDATNGYAYPVEILYTGNSAASLAPYNKVTFVYNTNRADQVPLYTAGALTQIKVLLTNVRTWEGANLVSDYQISYVSGASNIRGSRIASIKRCASDSSCLATTSFTWPAHNDPVAFSTTTSWAAGTVTPGDFIGDFNGDGLPDFLRSVYPQSGLPEGEASLWMSSGPGNWTSATREVGYEDWPPAEHNGFDLSGFWFTNYPMDMNGDGYSDILLDETALYSYPGQPDLQYGPLRRSSNINDHTGDLPIAQNYNAFDASKPVGDLNGDGRDDLLLLLNSPNASWPLYSSGDGWFTPGSSISGLHDNSWVVPGDFNGDGCMDLLSQLATDKIFYSCNAPNPSVNITDWVSAYNKLVLGDFNGDGNTDVLVTHQTNATTLMLATGTGLVSAGYTGPAGWAKYQISAGDFNGDGRSDLALIAANTTGGNFGPTTPHAIFLSTGTGFVSAGTISNPSGNNTARVHDFNGDGVADIWITKAAPANTNTLYTTNHTPMLITAINDGLGQVTTIQYQRLNGGNIYAKGTGATWPVMDMSGGQFVVAEAAVPNGAGGSVTYTHGYAGARLDHSGRGFLGFATRTVTEDRGVASEDLITTTHYRQDYPYTGLVAEQTLVRNSIELHKTTNSYAADTLSPAGTGGQRRFVRQTQSVAEARDLGGTQLPTVTTSYNSYDSFGNVTSVVVSGSGGDTKTTTNTWSNDSSNWLLARLTATTTVHALSGQSSITRKVGFEYFSTTGLLKKEIIEPDVPALKLTTDYTRDSFGNITSTTLSGTDITTRTSSQTFDSKGRFIATTTNAEGHVEAFVREPKFGNTTQHTDANSLVTTWQYDAHGRQTRVTDPDGRYQQTSYTWCSGVNGGSATCPTHGAMQIETVPWRAGGTVQSGAKTRLFVDRLGRERAQDVEGVGGSWIRTATEYDALGRIHRHSRPYFLSGGTAKWTTFAYDALGRVISEVYPDGSDTTTAYSGLVTTVTNDLGQATATTRNAQGHIALVQQPGTVTTTYLYNAVGDLIQIKDPANNTITHTVDTRGRITQSIDPSMGTWLYQYDVLDQLKQQTDAKSQTTTLTYDKLGRTLVVTNPGLTSTFTWDTATKGIGQLKEMATGTGGAGDKRSHTYDSFGRPATTTIRIDGTDYTYSSGYDADNRLYTVQYPSGFTARYEYTSNQKYLQTLKEHAGGGTLWTANARNAEGQLTQTTQAGFQINHAFDANTGRITAITAGTGNAIANMSFAWDALGNLTSRTDAVQSVTESFQYDSLNRLTQAAISGGVTKQVEYNAIGNILKKTRLGASGGGSSFNTYSYPAAGQARPYATSSISGTLNGQSNPSFSYDENGNLKNGAGREITWNAFNKVASLTEIIGGVTTTIGYVYDAQQQRLKQTTGSSVIRYLNDPASGISAEYHSDAGGTWHEYLFAEGRRVGLRIKPSTSAASWQAYVPDHLGSVAVVTDGSGSVLQRLSYDAWGLRRNPNGSDDSAGSLTAPTSRGFTDHEHLPVVGLINMNARMYDPELGRFLSPDSYIPDLLNSEALNRYSYVYNNPVAYTDPTGHWPAYVNINGGDLGAIARAYEPVFWAMVGVKVFAKLVGWGDEDTLPPPLLHRPGLSSVNEDMQASPRLHDVTPSTGFQSMEAGWSMWGGYKYNAVSEYALSHTQADAQKAPFDPNSPYLLAQVGTQQTAVVQPQSCPAGQATQTCQGNARILQGNSNHIGVSGGFGPNVIINSNSVAIDPAQWGGKGNIRPHLGNISGSVNGVQIFNNVAEVIGGKSPIPGMNVRDALRQLNPNTLILELPGGPTDMGVVPIVITIPCSMSCPAGTQ